jgi:kinesin family protein 15
VEDVLKLMQKGANSRHVGETRLNRESSRSHSVFTCTIEKTTVSDNGLKNVITSRLNLIDLAGGWAGGQAGGRGAWPRPGPAAQKLHSPLTVSRAC